ncbi:MAG: hypothetical protein KDJ26_00130 [Alphaproteobacteria bacterium]|nr:hypothetical protein [Alphaproteobacteria bacterium]MCB9985283.1 hypothetical protein [Micavibrio sp.]HPQ50168.1 hypothetical protein [Alphaproteobacteria bacterium]HRK98218.1 hypothetical protein [Alphaproteobacteria bacterium]
MAGKEIDPNVYFVKAKVYRFTSLLFITIGIIVFCILYVKNIDGKLLESLKNPSTIFYFLVPFGPGAVLTILADRAEKKYRDLKKKQ